MQDVIDAARVPLGSPAVVVKFCPDKMPEYWVANVVKREVKDLDSPMVASPSDNQIDLEALMDEVDKKEDEKAQACVGPL